MAQRGEAADYYNDSNGQKADDQTQSPQQAYGGQQYGNKTHGGQRHGNRQYEPPQHMPPPPTYDQNFGNWQEKPTFDQAFKVEKPKYNDIWAGILFLAVFAGFVAVSGITLAGYSSTYSFNGDGIYGSNNDFGLSTNTVVLFAFCLVMALVLGYGYIALARMFTKQFVWITGILNILWCLGTAIYMLVRHYWSGGIVFLLFGAFSAFCFWTWIPRIPFSVLMLQTAIDVSKTFGHVYLVSFLGGLVAAAFGAWFSITLVAVYVKYEPGNNPACSNGGSCSSASVIGLLVFITFAAYWISEWGKNTIHTTISGVYSAWFFAPRNPPKGATRGAFRRAITYSFGSISLGSLVVAIINMLRQACSIAQSSSANSGNMAMDCCFCILGCLLGLLDWAVQFINRYAFSYIALYGKSYVQAAKATWVSSPPRKSACDALLIIIVEVDQGSWNRRTCQRMPDRSRPDDGRDIRGVCLCPTRVPVPRLHRSWLQPKRRVHSSRSRLRFPDRPSNRQLLHHAVVEWHRYNLCSNGVGSGSLDEGAWRSLSAHD